MNGLLSILWLFFVFPLVLAGMFLGFLLHLVVSPINNEYLRAFAESLAAIEHPLDSISLGSTAHFGNLGAASNHCDYLVAELRATPLSRAELVEHYKDVVIPAPDVYFGEASPVELWFFDEIISEYSEADKFFNSPSAFGVDPPAYRDQLLYLVYADEYGAPPGADIRCH